MWQRAVSLVLLLTIFASPARAADYNAANEDIWPSQNDIAQTAGNGKKLLENQWQDVLAAVTDQGNLVYSGCVLPASSVNLNISVPACQALISGRFVDIPGSTSLTATASLTNSVFLKVSRDGSSLATGAVFEVNTTGTAPADSVAIGTLVASGSAITSTTDRRRLGPPAPYRGPWSVGTGSTRSHEGAVTISANQNLSGIHFYTDFTINSSTTLTVPAGKRRLVIIASGTITINGTINASGAGSAGGAGGAPNTAGSPGVGGTSQPGSAGGAGTGGAPGGAAGGIWIHGIQVSSAAVTGSDVWLQADPLSCIGGGGGGGGGGDNSSSTGGTGGTGGGSIVLIAPSIVLGATATLNTSGLAGSAGGAFAGTGGQGGAGNIYLKARSYTDNGATFTQTGGGVKQILLY